MFLCVRGIIHRIRSGEMFINNIFSVTPNLVWENWGMSGHIENLMGANVMNKCENIM